MSDIVFKIQSGTRSGEDDLCKTCSRSMIIKGSAESHESVYCHSIEKWLRERVSECSGYYNKSLPALRDLYQTAWILSPSEGKKGALGFVPFNKWKETRPKDDVHADEFY